MFSFPLGRALMVLIGASVGAASLFVGVLNLTHTSMNLESSATMVIQGETFTVSLLVASEIPVNVFAGDLSFDPDVLRVQSIDYNTSIADLWAEEPWYENGSGTLTFAGGTTKSGGFTGNGTLLTITFTTVTTGETRVHIDDIKILQYDGLGSESDAPTTIDNIFTIVEPAEKPQAIVNKAGGGPRVTVVAQKPVTDLNNDGKQSTADLSIFMTDMVSQNKRSDFNQDGRVGIRDLSIMFGAD